MSSIEQLRRDILIQETKLKEMRKELKKLESMQKEMRKISLIKHSILQHLNP